MIKINILKYYAKNNVLGIKMDPKVILATLNYTLGE